MPSGHGKAHQGKPHRANTQRSPTQFFPLKKKEQCIKGLLWKMMQGFSKEFFKRSGSFMSEKFF